MSVASSSPKNGASDRACNIRKPEEEPCNVTDDNPGADCFEAMHAFKKIRTSTSGLRKSPNKWTKEENQKLASLVACYGEKKWKRISSEMGGQKTGAQCAQHWKRVLSPEIRKGHWDENEEELLLHLVVQYGSCWKKIAKKIPQRTDIQCRYQYLKAKQSREVKWDPKEDETLIKKVMEMASGETHKFFNNTHSFNSENNASPSNSSPNHLNTTNKENEADNSPISLGDSRDSMKLSGETSAWNYDHNNITMHDDSGESSPASSASRSPLSPAGGSPLERDPNATPPSPSHTPGVVVWLEIAEHMARMKLTSTLRTALECKTRFAELLGNKSPFTAQPNFCGNSSSPECNSKYFDLKGSGGINKEHANTPESRNKDTNINININTSNNNINITHFTNNITININSINHKSSTSPSNSPPTHSHSPPHPPHSQPRNVTIPIKTELPPPTFMDTSCFSLPTASIHPTTTHHTMPVTSSLISSSMSNAQITLPPIAHIALTASSTITPHHIPSMRSMLSGLDSLAAVASTREMLADCAQF